MESLCAGPLCGVQVKTHSGIPFRTLDSGSRMVFPPRLPTDDAQVVISVIESEARGVEGAFIASGSSGVVCLLPRRSHQMIQHPREERQALHMIYCHQLYNE